MSHKDGGGTLIGKLMHDGRLGRLVAEGKLKLSSCATEFFSMGMLMLRLLHLPTGLRGGVEDAIGSSLSHWLSQCAELG